MAIPWLPKETSSRLLRPHEEDHLKAAYQLGTAYVAGFLSRDDGKRPSWFNRMRLVPTSSLPADIQEHLGSICHLICTKVRQEATADPGSKAAVGAFSGQARPETMWKGALLCARVIWRTVFAAAAAKAEVSQKAVPLLFMVTSQSMLQAARKLLTILWNEAQLEYTSRVNKYHNIKSRPPWSSLEGLEYKVFGEMFGFGLLDPKKAEVAAGTKMASNLQDWYEEVLALRFMVDWLSASVQDAQEYLEHATRRMLKRQQPRGRIADNVVTMKLNEMKDKATDSFLMMWTYDAELRAVAGLSARVMDGLEGPGCSQFAATFGAQLLLAVWKGVQPMFQHVATLGISRLSEAHAARGILVSPALEQEDEDHSQTATFDKVAASYGPPSADCLDLMSALPRGVIGAIVKVQATWRGYIFRARYFTRARHVASYCKAAHWPLQEPFLFEATGEAESPKGGKRRKKVAKKVDAKTLEAEIQEFQPEVSKYLGGGTVQQDAARKAKGPAPAGSATMTGKIATKASEVYERRAWPLPTADHRACADLFALYMYNMYRRKELIRMWQTLCQAYERGIDSFSALLEKNPALKPMLESIAAQLKRGSVVGYDKAFIAKQQPESKGKKAAVDADLFRKPASKSTSQAPGDGGAARTPSATQPGPGQSTMLPPMTLPLNDTQARGSEFEMTGEYLQNYLKEMDGDDSQFKDISAAVIPLSTGQSPERRPAAESILAEEEAAAAAAAGSDPSATPAKKRPKLDVPFCMQRIKPIWLPIKAHRFAAYRAKVLQLLPEKVLKQYIDFEHKQLYAACIKLLESATPGSLNVLSPSTLVSGKPLLVETVLQLIVGYSGLCLKHGQGQVAVKLITQVLDSMSLALRDLHPGHRTVLEAYLFDTAMSVCYYMPNDLALSERAESFFQQASERYLRLNHTNRYCKCCLRAAAVLHQQGNKKEAEYYTQQALNKLADAPVCSLLAVCYHNLAVHTMSQNRMPDGVAHVRSYVALIRQLPKLGNATMQHLDNTQWLILKMQELWPQYQSQSGMRDGQVTGGRP